MTIGVLRGFGLFFGVYFILFCFVLFCFVLFCFVLFCLGGWVYFALTSCNNVRVYCTTYGVGKKCS